MSKFDSFKRFVFTILAFVNIAVLCIFAYIWVTPTNFNYPIMTRGDYLDLSLSLLGVILAAVTIFLAIAAFFAYYDIRRAAERMAEQTTMDVIQRLSNGEEIFFGGERLSLARADSDSSVTESQSPDVATSGDEVGKEEEQKDL